MKTDARTGAAVVLRDEVPEPLLGATPPAAAAAAEEELADAGVRGEVGLEDAVVEDGLLGLGRALGF